MKPDKDIASWRKWFGMICIIIIFILMASLIIGISEPFRKCPRCLDEVKFFPFMWCLWTEERPISISLGGNSSLPCS